VPIVTAIYELEHAMRAEGKQRTVQLAKRASGQWVARVWPSNMVSVFFPRFQGEVRRVATAGPVWFVVGGLVVWLSGFSCSAVAEQKAAHGTQAVAVRCL